MNVFDLHEALHPYCRADMVEWWTMGEPSERSRLRRATLTSAAAMVLALGAPAAAQQDPRVVQPERPTVATHAYTVAPGYLEIEAGVQEARPGGTTQFVAPFVAKFGIAAWIQLEVQGGYLRNAASDATMAGVADLAVALKERVLVGAPLVHDFSVQESVKFATGARDIGTGTTDLSLLLISSRPIGAAQLDLNAGYTHRSGNGATVPTSATLLTASLGAPIRGRLGGVAELFGYPGTGGPTGTPPAIGFLFGPTLQVKPWLVLDAGAILNVRSLGANALYAGVTYNAGRIPGFPSRGGREQNARGGAKLYDFIRRVDDIHP
jgi:hypothetical protein